MGRCPSCGASSLFAIKTRQCVGCGKIGCNKCLPHLQFPFQMKVIAERGINPAIYEYAGFCSLSCTQKFWDRVGRYPLQNMIGTDLNNFDFRVIDAWNQAILGACTNDFVAKAEEAIRLHSRRYPAFPWIGGDNKFYWMYTDLYRKAKLALGQNLERCGRTKDAAIVFEELYMYDKSRELRERDRHIIVKNTNVSVNLNALLQQVKDGGIVTIFRCPFCGANLKINKDTSLDSLRVCEYCHSEISSMDLADFLNAVLR